MKWKFVFALLIALASCKNSYSTELIPFGNKLKKVYISEDNVPVYEFLSNQEEISITLNTLDVVYLISNKTIIEGKKSEIWYYVDTWIPIEGSSESITIKGWINGKYLLGRAHFRPVRKIKEMFIMMEGPEGGAYYHLYPNGTYSTKCPEDKKSKLYFGKIYQYKNIISLNLMEFFYYDEENNLRNRDFKIEVITNKKKFPF